MPTPEHPADADPVTVGGERDRGQRFVDTERHLFVDTTHRAQMAAETEPNGWFAGPQADPDRFELLGPGLAGGEGNTWRGRYRGELTAPLTLAVKELRRPPHAGDDWPAQADLRRWNDQRALLQYMRIDHLVTVIDIFVGPAPHLPGTAQDAPADTPYVVMEWVPGPTLADEVSGSPATGATLDERLSHVQHVAEALHALHSRTASAGNPTLHRDVKPTNCILDPRRGVVLVDVGTMRRVDDGFDHDGFHTPAYTAPEVLANPHAARAASSDLYSLGALAYFCVVGADPPLSDQPGAGAQMEDQLLAAAAAARVADARGFVEHLRLMLDPSPEQRPGDPMSWARRLRALGAVRGPGRSARMAVVLAGALVAGLAFAAVQALGSDDRNPVGALPASGSDPGVGPGVAPGPGVGVGRVPESAPAGADGTVRTEVVRIVTPVNGSPAPRCTLVTGTAKLPAGLTLLTAVENVDHGDGVRHLQVVQGWQRPEALVRWEGWQFIGLPGEPAGGRFRIEVLTVPLDGLRQQIEAAGGERGRWRGRIPTGSKVMASVFVTRAGDSDPAACPDEPPPPPPPPGS